MFVFVMRFLYTYIHHMHTYMRIYRVYIERFKGSVYSSLKNMEMTVLPS